jgi:hypothetical protein
MKLDHDTSFRRTAFLSPKQNKKTEEHARLTNERHLPVSKGLGIAF